MKQMYTIPKKSKGKEWRMENGEWTQYAKVAITAW
jgi:hypothetical protein